MSIIKQGSNQNFEMKLQKKHGCGVHVWYIVIINSFTGLVSLCSSYIKDIFPRRYKYYIALTKGT